jgi:hypothetical protein
MSEEGRWHMNASENGQPRDDNWIPKCFRADLNDNGPAAILVPTFCLWWGDWATSAFR